MHPVSAPNVFYLFTYLFYLFILKSFWPQTIFDVNHFHVAYSILKIGLKAKPELSAKLIHWCAWRTWPVQTYHLPSISITILKYILKKMTSLNV